MLTKEQILQAQDLEYRDEEVPKWGGSVRLWQLTVADRDAFEESISKLKPSGQAEIIRENFRAKLVARCLGDEDGNRLFSDKEIMQLGKKSAKVVDRLFVICQQINGMSEEDQERFVKNSEGEE